MGLYKIMMMCLLLTGSLVNRAFACSEIINEEIVKSCYKTYRQENYETFKKEAAVSSLGNISSAVAFVDQFNPVERYSRDQISQTKIKMIREGYGLGGIDYGRKATSEETYVLLQNIKYLSPYAIAPSSHATKPTTHESVVDGAIRVFQEVRIAKTDIIPPALDLIALRNKTYEITLNAILPISKLFEPLTFKGIVEFTNDLDRAGNYGLKTNIGLYNSLLEKSGSSWPDLLISVQHYVVKAIQEYHTAHPEVRGTDFIGHSTHDQTALDKFIQSGQFTIDRLRVAHTDSTILASQGPGISLQEALLLKGRTLKHRSEQETVTRASPMDTQSAARQPPAKDLASATGVQSQFVLRKTDLAKPLKPVERQDTTTPASPEPNEAQKKAQQIAESRQRRFFSSSGHF